MSRRFRIAVVTAALVGGIGLPLLPAAAADSATISGVAFDDTNRNGVQDPGEAARPSDVVYLFDASDTAIGTATTAADGRYSFTNLTPGAAYRVAYSSQSWWGIRRDWAPTTTGSLRPSRFITAPDATADFGWRAVVRTVPPAAPITSVTGPEGLRVESYDDVVSAADIYSALLRGTVGREASTVLVRFDASTSSTTSSAVTTGADGQYDAYAASVSVAYESWLDSADQTLSHEYGHAWSMYYGYLVQQDPTLTGYLQARGLAGDARVDSSYAWSRREMIAEDYRQLLGSPTAASAPQMNRDIPPAAAVPGLRDYLLGTFTGGAATATTTSPSPSTSASPSPSPSTSSSPSPSPSPTASTASPSASPSPTATKGNKSGGCKRC